MDEPVHQPLLKDHGTGPPHSFLPSLFFSAFGSFTNSSIFKKSTPMSAEEKKLQKSYFEVLGICCSTEVILVENILKSLDGIKEFSVIVPTRTVIVLHDDLLVSQLEIVKALNRARLEANVRAYGKSNHQKNWPSPFVISCGVLFLLSFFKYVYHPLRWLAIGAVVVGIFPVGVRGYASLRNFRIDISILVLITVIGTIAMADYTEAATIVFLFTVAEWLESRASQKASSVMQSMTSIAPQKAVIAETGQEVDVGNVELNTILAVKTGEVIPMDGVVVAGECEVDERTLTGESFPVAKQIDSFVLAGTINLNGYISVNTTALAEDCVVAKMAKLVEESQNSKTKTQRFIDNCVQIYTPVVIIISASFAVIPAALRVHNCNHWFHLALVVLVSACPCALVLSTPVASFCALTKAASFGLLIKGGDYLETLAKIKFIAFDKTGTITRGEFVVTDFQSLCNDININSLLYWVSSIESKSSHPVAAALVDYGRSLSIKPKPEDVEEFQNFPGEGIHGRIDGIDVYIGNRKITLRAGCGTVPTWGGNSQGGETVGYIYVGASLAGIFSVSDACRSGAVGAIEELKLMRIKTAMLTGDSNAAAMHAQQQLGNSLELVFAELLPKDKATIIEGFKKDGLTAMIGDGVNDAPALAIADIGISMGIAGSALATETGHMILMSNDIRKIPKAVQLARKTRRKVIENVILSFFIKAAILVLAFAGHPIIWAAVLADAGTCLLVIFNSMLLLRGIKKPGANSSTHKLRCNTTGDSLYSHNRQKCCSEKKPQAIFENQNCCTETCASKCQPKPFSLDSCGNRLYPCFVEQKASMLCVTEKGCNRSCASKCQPKPSSSDQCENNLQPCCSEKLANKLCQAEKCCTQSSRPKSSSSDSCGSSNQSCCSEKKTEGSCVTENCCKQSCQPNSLSSNSCRDTIQPCCSEKKAEELCKSETEMCSNQSCASKCQSKPSSPDLCENSLQPCCSEKLANKFCQAEKCCTQSTQPKSFSSDSCGSSNQPCCSEKKTEWSCVTKDCCTQSSHPNSLSSNSCEDTIQPCCSEKKAEELCKSETKMCGKQSCASKCQPKPFNSDLCWSGLRPCCSEKKSEVSRVTQNCCEQSCQDNALSSDSCGNSNQPGCCEKKAKELAKTQRCPKQSCDTKCQVKPCSFDPCGNNNQPCCSEKKAEKCHTQSSPPKSFISDSVGNSFQTGCSEKEVLEISEKKYCAEICASECQSRPFSSRSCGNFDKYSDSADIPGLQSCKATCYDHGKCKMASRDMKEHCIYKDGCSGTDDESEISLKRQDDCTEAADEHVVKNCSCCNIPNQDLLGERQDLMIKQLHTTIDIPMDAC